MLSYFWNASDFVHKMFMSAAVQEDMSYKRSNIGSLSCREQLLHSTQDKQYQHQPLMLHHGG